MGASGKMGKKKSTCLHLRALVIPSPIAKGIYEGKPEFYFRRKPDGEDCNLV